MSKFLKTALDRAEAHLVKGELEKAKSSFNSILAVFPKNNKAVEGLHKIKQLSEPSTPPKLNPPQDKIQQVINFYKEGKFWEVIQKVEEITLYSTPNVLLFNLVAAAHAGLKNFDCAIENFEKILKINPDDAITYYNIGNIYKEKKEYGLEIKSYQKALTIKPDHAESHNNMGNAFKAKGDLDAAIKNFISAISLKPDFAEAYYNLGTVMGQQGDSDAALKNYKKATEIKPQYFKAHLNIADALRNNGDLKLAIDSYKQAIKINPGYANTYFNMGITFKEIGDLNAAIESYKEAIKIKFDYAEAYLNMGIALSEKGEFDAAISSYKEAIKIKPNYAKAYNNIANVLADQGDLDAAIDNFQKSLKINSSVAETYYNMGVVLRSRGELDAAIDGYQQAIKINPDHVRAYTNLGAVLRDKQEPDAAIESYKKAIKINPDYANAHYNLGIALKENGEIDAAIESYRQAIKIKPDYADANLNQSLAYLHKGDFKSGWVKHEWRWAVDICSSVPLKSINPKWNLSEKNRVLLWAEQGIGDEIMFASVIPDLYSSCSKLIVKIDKRLIALFRRSFPEDIDFRVHDEAVSETEYDAHIPMGSLPLHFRQTIDSFKPTARGWLTACDVKASRLRRTLLSDGSETLIGISWYSTKPRKGAEKKVMKLAQLARKLDAPKVKLINLQYGDVNDELDSLQKETGIEVIQVPEINNKTDIDDLAALIMACDKVVSISNVTIHLAGALGKEAQLLLASLCDWRWGQSSKSSYWYNSVRLYRQTKIDDWDNVLKQL